MILLSLDPGKLASWAKTDTERPHLITCGELSLTGMGRYLRPCPLELAELLHDVDLAIIEEVGARPNEGASSTFTFGMCLGTLLGALGAKQIPIETVSPQKWRAAAQLNGFSGEAAKQASLQAARQLWPHLSAQLKAKRTHGLAEAGLIGRWYLLAGPGKRMACSQRLLADNEPKNVTPIRSKRQSSP